MLQQWGEVTLEGPALAQEAAFEVMPLQTRAHSAAPGSVSNPPAPRKCRTAQHTERKTLRTKAKISPALYPLANIPNLLDRVFSQADLRLAQIVVSSLQEPVFNI